nr:hypothetical protein [Tanacetum cinerariifolium]
ELSERSLWEDIKITDKLESLEKDNNGIKNLDTKNIDVVIVFQNVGKQDFETNKGEVLNLKSLYVESKPESSNTKLNSSVIGSEVVEVSQVKFDSISTDTMSITEKNELKDNVIADDVKIEVDLKPAHPSFSKVTLDDGNTKSVMVDVPLKDRKLSLDPSSGVDSMEEHVLETKQINSKFTSQHIGYVNEKTQVPPFKEGEPLDVMANDTHAPKNDESAKDTSDYAAVSTKRKLNDNVCLDLAPIPSAVLTDQHICMIHLEIMKSNITCQCYSYSGEGNCRRA